MQYDENTKKKTNKHTKKKKTYTHNRIWKSNEMMHTGRLLAFSLILLVRSSNIKSLANK